MSDTGVGIPPDVLPRIFDRFHQADPSSKRGQDGLGLGLSIVQNLVDLHGGRIHAESPGEGQGAVFTVVLPCARLRAPPRPRIVPRREQDGVVVRSGQSERITSLLTRAALPAVVKFTARSRSGSAW